MRSRLPAIGELTERVDLQSRSDAAVAGGGTTETYTTIATVWAKVEAVAGSLYFASQQTDQTTTHAIIVRGRSDATTVQYIRWNSRRFEVRTVRDLDPGPRFQELLCEELKSGV